MVFVLSRLGSGNRLRVSIDEAIDASKAPRSCSHELIDIMLTPSQEVPVYVVKTDGYM